MTSYDLNSYPEKIRTGVVSIREAVDHIATFISEDYKVFKLQNYDEDFRSDLVMIFLENGEKILKAYNPKLGDFFNYLYCYVNSIIYSRTRDRAKKKIKESIALSEGINAHYEKEYKYGKLTYHVNDIPKAPYAYKKIDPEELKRAFSLVPSETKDKKILALALKSSFYLNDEQINKICRIYKMNLDTFYNTVQYLKETFEDKCEKRTKLMERRNYSYFHTKKYSLEIKNVQDSYYDSPNNDFYKLLTQRFKEKQIKHEHHWKKFNSRFEKGFMLLRPTTKVVSELLGICEREVTYLLNCAKKDTQNNEENEDKKIT